MNTISEVKADAEIRMNKSLKSLDDELAKQRVGRASPNILEDIMVSYYGNDTPLMQVATITVEGPMTLMVKPWEKNLVPTIEKAIIAANLGLNPSSGSEGIRVPFPPLSEERRKELTKKVRSEVENAKVALRNIRRDANGHIKELLKNKIISEDEERYGQELIQKLTDGFVKRMDDALAKKEKDLMSI